MRLREDPLLHKKRFRAFKDYPLKRNMSGQKKK